MFEIKAGFVPNSADTSAYRLRRRYRMSKGGHPQLMVVHYTRGPPTRTYFTRCPEQDKGTVAYGYLTAIIPTLQNQPVRQYPLPQITEPPVFVHGDRAGQKVMSGGRLVNGTVPPGFNPQQAQAMLAAQSNNLEMMERMRREQAAGRGAPAAVFAL